MHRHTIACTVIAAVCAFAIAPFFWMGIPSGHDIEFHLFSWMEVENQWKQGIAYPRWADLADWGYGEPRFLFYPPASWMLGAALGSTLPWKTVPGGYCWLALTLAGFAMYNLARQWLRPADALFAAVFYALNPYHILVIYWRSAYAELLSAALLPLLLLFVLKLSDSSSRPVVWLSVVFAAAWFTNIPAAMMIHYSAGGLALVMAMRDRSPRPLWRLAIAVVVGAGLASIYLVPAVYEQGWVNIGQVLSPGVRPQDNFLFTMSADADHNHFNLLISTVAVAEMAVLLAALFFSRSQRRSLAWMAGAVWGVAAATLMFSITNPLWEYLPEFRFVQLPFRWLLCLNAALALLLAMTAVRSALRRCVLGGLVYAALLALLIFVAVRTQPPWWDSASDIDDMEQSIADGTGYEGVDEYVPAGDDPYDLNKDLPRLSEEGGGEAGQKRGIANTVNSEIVKWNATEKQFRIVAESPANVIVRLFNYPAWRVTVNGRQVKTKTSPGTGLMIVPLEAGTNKVQISFATTPDRKLGGAISLLGLAIFAAAYIRTNPRLTTKIDA